MSKDWPFAKLAQDAAANGGPDNYINSIKTAAYLSGVTDTKNKLIVPLLLAGTTLGTVGTIVYQKVQTHISQKQEEKTQLELEAEEAEELLKKELNKLNPNIEKI